MQRFTLLVLLCLIAVACPASAQGALPSSFADWTASGPSIVNRGAGLVQTLGPDAAILREYSVRSLERREYAHGTDTAKIALYQFRDPSSAYGAYTFFRNDSLAPEALGSFGCASRDHALIVIGNLLVDISAKQMRPSNAELKVLADSLSKVADHAPFPTIAEYLPEKGLVPRSEHYVVGPRALSLYVPIATDDWIGFDYSAEVIVARYHLAHKDATLLVASYPTQQIAADKFGTMLRRFVFDPPGGVPPNQTVLYGKRSSSLVAIVMGAPSQKAANALLDKVRYEPEVTWNEPTHTLTDPSIGNIVVGTFLGTGAIMLFAIAAGLGFGGVRVVMKVFFPNKIFDREKQIEILQLGIFSKPIHANDFYQKSSGLPKN